MLTKSKLLLALALTAATVSAVGAADVKFYGSGAERQAADALHGRPAFELEDVTWVQGGPVKLKDLKGKVVLLDFWAQWCGPCLKALPAVQELEHKYGGKGLVVIGIHSGRGSDELPRFLKERKIKNPVAIEGPSKSNEKRYGTTGYPTFTFIGRDGKIRYADVLPDSLDAAAGNLLAESAPVAVKPRSAR